jgi:NAD(P)-dependent dehydrogenase (short-subunit alcohol dehydrogenase family)
MKNPGTVLITGASTGIGRAIALHLDQLGWKVFAGVRKPADAEALQKEGSDALRALILDVTDGATIASAIREVESGAGELDALVNNAGITVNGPMEFIPMEGLRRQMEVNFFGVVAMTQAALPLIRKTTGRIVHIGSIGGRQAAPILGPYAASKYAIEAIGEAQRRELSPWGIEVIVVEPGAIATPIWAKGQAAANETLEAASPRELELYGPAFEALLAAAADNEKRAVGPEAVAVAVEDALTRKRPKPRYLVGTDAKILGLMTRLLPDRVRDAFILRVMKYPRSA